LDDAGAGAVAEPVDDTVSTTVGSVDTTSPVAVDDELTVALTETGSVDLIANDSDVGGSIDGASLIIVDPPDHGTATNNFDGTVDYQSVDSQQNDSFTYTVDDDSGNVSNIATVQVTQTGAGSIPQSGLIVHLETDVGIVTDASLIVQSWADQAGGDNSLIGAGSPTLIEESLNGKDVIDFDGIDSKLQTTTNLTGLPAGASDRTVFTVINYRDDEFGGFAYGSVGANRAFGLVTNQIDQGTLTVQGWGPIWDDESLIRGQGVGWLVQSAVVDSNVLTHYANGFEIDNVPHTYDTIVTKMVIGEEIRGQYDIDMQIAAVLVYDRALTNSERTTVENYLQDKYLNGSPVNLPPAAVNDDLSVEADGVTNLDITVNDLDVDGTIDGTTIIIVSDPLGSLTDSGDGTLSYTPVSGTTTDTFTYIVADNDGGMSNVATVNITVGP